MVRLEERIKKEINPALIEKLGITNINAIPSITMVSCNVGTGYDGVENKAVIDAVKKDLSLITGQMPVVTKAKQAISNFKLRKGMPVGCKVTLRKGCMYNFIDKLLHIVMPRIRDFRGVSRNAFDQAGNFSIGLQEHIIFPEINIEKVTYTFGMNITFVINNGDSKKSFELLEMMGMPFQRIQTKAE